MRIGAQTTVAATCTTTTGTTDPGDATAAACSGAGPAVASAPDADGPTDLGDEVYADGKKVGVITCPCYSKLTNKSMAIMRVDVAHANQGAKLEVRGKNVEAKAIAHTITFDDPEKKKRTAVG